MLMKQVGIRGVAKKVSLDLEHLRVDGVRIRHGLDEEIEKSAGLGDASGSVRKLFDVKFHQVADHAAHVPAGISVVADVSQAVGRQVAAANCQDFVLHLGGDPGINPVANDVIVRSVVILHVHNALGLELDVGESQGVNDFLSHGDLPRRQVDAEKLAFGQRQGHGDEVAAGGAAQLQ